jgi:hypothetical protein
MFSSMQKAEYFKGGMDITLKLSVFSIASLDRFFVLMKKGGLRN